MNEYISGSREEVNVDLTCDAPGFAVASWTGEMAFGISGVRFDVDAATWTACTLTPGATTDSFTATLMLEDDVVLAVGSWNVYVRLTHGTNPNAEKPVIPAVGVVRIV